MKHHRWPHRFDAFMSTLSMLGLAAFANIAHADAQKFNQQMQPILEEYLKIPQQLAADKTDGVAEAAAKIKQLCAKLDSTTVSGEHAGHFTSIAVNLRAAADKIAMVKNIDDMRNGLKDLSKPMAMWATMSKPKGISVMYCSMAPGSWLQRGTLIANPYYGAKMLRCGDIVAGEGFAKADPASKTGEQGMQTGHSEHGTH